MLLPAAHCDVPPTARHLTEGTGVCCRPGQDAVLAHDRESEPAEVGPGLDSEAWLRGQAEAAGCEEPAALVPRRERRVQP